MTEAAGANAASPLASLKKVAVAAGAEQTLAGLGWLPAMLRTHSSVSAQEPLDGEVATNVTDQGDEEALVE